MSDDVRWRRYPPGGWTPGRKRVYRMYYKRAEENLREFLRRECIEPTEAINEATRFCLAEGAFEHAEQLYHEAQENGGEFTPAQAIEFKGLMRAQLKELRKLREPWEEGRSGVSWSMFRIGLLAARTGEDHHA